MSDITNGRMPAFPCVSGTEGYGNQIFVTDPGGTHHFNTVDLGLIKREYLAAKAMQAHLSTYNVSHNELDESQIEGIAKFSYRMADAMMREGQK